MGEVVGIKTDLNRHYIIIKIRKNFYIPKKGSSISIATWGYFGQKFVNINIYKGAETNLPYSKGDIISMDPPLKLNETIQKFHSLIEKKDEKARPSNKKANRDTQDDLQTQE